MFINQLENFVMTVKLGSYAAAAKRVFLSAPGVSRSVRELEKKLGVKLVERVGKVVKPTKNGMELYPKIVSALNEIDDLKAMASCMALNKKEDSTYILGMTKLFYQGVLLLENSLHDLLTSTELEKFIDLPAPSEVYGCHNDCESFYECKKCFVRGFRNGIENVDGNYQYCSWITRNNLVDIAHEIASNSN